MTTDKTEQKRSRSRLKWSDITLLIAVLPIVVAALRIWLFSGGDTAVFLTLLRTLDITAVLVGTGALMIPTLLMILLVIVVTDWKAREYLGEKMAQSSWYIWAVLIVGIVLLYTASWWAYVGMGIVAIFLLLVFLITRYWPWGSSNVLDRVMSRKGSTTRPDSLTTLVSTLAVFLMAPTSMWLPLERIGIQDRDPTSGYVLETDSEWTTILTGKGTKVEVIRSGQVESREICDSNFKGSIATSIFRKGEQGSDAPDCD